MAHHLHDHHHHQPIAPGIWLTLGILASIVGLAAWAAGWLSPLATVLAAAIVLTLFANMGLSRMR